MHLLVTIAAHGFGHLSQTAPVLNRLQSRLPGLRLTVVSQLPRALLQQQIQAPFQHIVMETEVGMYMGDALSVNRQASLEAYRHWRRDWAEHIDRFLSLLRRQAPDLLLSNVSYLALVAARRLHIPAIALCSLNWADVLEAYVSETVRSDLVEPIREAYQEADLFLQCRPHMPMTWLENTRSIGVIARHGEDRRQQLLAAAGGEYEHIVLVSLGGIDFRYSEQHLPSGNGVLWILQGNQPVKSPDVITTQGSGLPFIDLAATADAWICKPGYGSFTEAAVNATPMLYLSRDEWPEEPYLVQWMQQYGVCAPFQRQAWEQGSTMEVLQELWRKPHPPTPLVDGIDEAVEQLYSRLA